MNVQIDLHLMVDIFGVFASTAFYRTLGHWGDSLIRCVNKYLPSRNMRDSQLITSIKSLAASDRFSEPMHSCWQVYDNAATYKYNHKVVSYSCAWGVDICFIITA